MAVAATVWTSFAKIIQATGVPYSGAKVNVYAAGTTTPLSLFSDTGLSVSVANPIVCGTDGQHAMVYFAPVAYKTTVTDSSNVTLTSWSKDNIDPGVPITTGALPVANGGTGSTTAGAARTALGAAADSTVTTNTTNISTLTAYHTGTAKLPIALGTTAQRPGTPTNGWTRFNSTLTAPEMYLTGAWHQVSLAPPAPHFRKLLIVNNAGTPNSKVDITADAVVAVDSNNVAVLLASVSLTIDAATTGANGLDAGSLANSTWYYHYIIYNPTTDTTAGLTSTSATSPTMPSGYTFKIRVGAHTTDGSAHYHRIRQAGRKAQYVVSAATTTAYPMMSTGATGTPATPTFTTVAVGAFVPTTATEISVIVGNNNGVSILSANNLTGGSGSTTNPGVLNITAPGAAVYQQTATFELESTNIYYAASVAASFLACCGWTDNL